jgi:metal-responsive CopG/Arc/MetJ family transcriptional regulator
MGSAPDEVVPEGEGPLSQAITVRLPKRLLADVEQIAKETKNNRSDTILHLLRWARAEYQARAKKGKTG